jgi:hypothetical protein
MSTQQEMIDVVPGKLYAEAVCLVDMSGVPYVAGGTPVGSGLSDTELTDDSGKAFLARDIGTSISYVTLTGVAYTPTTNIRPITATSANQITTNAYLSTISTTVQNIPVKGQVIMSGSTPVTIASDQSAIPVTLPGVATTAGQAAINNAVVQVQINTQNSNNNIIQVASNTANIPSKGQSSMSGSTPVTIASDQSSIPVTVANVATAANQVTASAILTTINTAVQKIPSKGMTNAANSMPVVLASDSNAIPVYMASYNYVHTNIVNNSLAFLVKPSGGVLKRVVVCSPGTGCQAILYDGTSTSGIIMGYVNLGVTPVTLEFDCAFTNGLYVTAGGTNSASFTIIYR